MLRVDCLQGPAALEALEPEWNSVVEDLSPFLPFRSALWNRLWWTHFQRRGWFQSDEFFVHVVRNDEGRLLGVAPLMLTRTGVKGLPRLRIVQFFGRDPFMTEVRGLICRPEDHNDVFNALHHHLLAHQSEFDWCQWNGLIREGLDSDATSRVRWNGQLPDYYLGLPATWEEFKSGLSRNIKESIRKCYNSLKRDRHEFVFRVVSDPSAVACALDRFFELHANRSDAKHANVFATPRARAFLADYTSQMAARGQLRIFQLEIAGTVVATRIGLVQDRELYLYYSGYEVRWGKYSVMTTTTAEAIQWAIRNGFRIVNLSAGRDVSKTRWRPSEIVFHDGIQFSRTLRSMWAFRGHSLLGLGESDSRVRRRLLTTVSRAR
jgi:CelD/BcsL family acetyltransferase involved in cellulose biosynthesis